MGVSRTGSVVALAALTISVVAARADTAFAAKIQRVPAGPTADAPGSPATSGPRGLFLYDETMDPLDPDFAKALAPGIDGMPRAEPKSAQGEIAIVERHAILRIRRLNTLTSCKARPRRPAKAWPPD
jgi:hypothetical protein